MAVGSNTYGACEVSGWTDIVAVSSNLYGTVGLRSDGTVVIASNYGAYDAGDVSGWADIVAIDTGDYHLVGLRSDGTVVAVGGDIATGDFAGANDVSGWTGVVAVASAGHSTFGVRSDGTVVAVGSNTWGQINVSSWTDIVAAPIPSLPLHSPLPPLSGSWSPYSAPTASVVFVTPKYARWSFVGLPTLVSSQSTLSYSYRTSTNGTTWASAISGLPGQVANPLTFTWVEITASAPGLPDLTFTFGPGSLSGPVPLAAGSVW